MHVVSKARLGIAALTISPELRTHLGGPADRGVLVDAVRPDSPAARAGLRVGDLVTDVAGAPATSAADVIQALSDHEKGDEIAIAVIRDGKPVDLTAKLEDDPDAAATVPFAMPDDLDRWFRFDGGPYDLRGAFEELQRHMRELEKRLPQQAAPHQHRI